MKITIHDVETTGLSAKTDRIVEYGCVTFDENGKERSSYGVLVRPRRNSNFVPMDAFRIHGISSAMLKAEGKLWEDVAPNIHRILSESDIIVAFNASFDEGFVKEGLGGVGLDYPEKPCVDPLRVAQRFIPYEVAKKKNLLALCRLMDIPLDKAHRAVHDCRSTGELLFKLIRELEIELTDLISPQPLCLGKFHTGVKHLDPFTALYNGLPRKGGFG